MRCANCGAELRPNARFCNQCGAAAGGAVAVSERAGGPTSGPMGLAASRAMGGPTSGPVGATAAMGDASLDAAAPDTAGPAGQTPTVPVAALSWDEPAQDAAANHTGASSAPAPDAWTTSGHLPPAASEPTPIQDYPTGPLGPGTASTVDQAHAAASPASGANGTAAAATPPAEGTTPASAPRQWDDGLPWPLPTGLILDGRYRVEGLVGSEDDENAYRVTDLRGYERCWACGEIHGASAASERFCRDCGADMLARELTMRERWLGDTDAPEAAVLAAMRQDDDSTADVRLFAQGKRAYRVEPKLALQAAFPLGARIVAGAASDIGRTRRGEQNEDSALVLLLDRLHDSVSLPCGIFAVADGLGGHANGQRASRLAVNVLAHTMLRQVALPLIGAAADAPVDETLLATLLLDAVQDANRSLCASNQDTGVDAGSTLVAALVYGEVAHLANVGDSRAYVCDEHGLRRITSDHSLVEQLVAGGMITPDEVYTHPQRNQIFRSLGDDPDVLVDIFTQELRPGMRVLLCSDGLWEMVRDPKIAEILRGAPDPQAACDALVVAANEGGGEDNVTAVVIEAR